VPRTPPSLSRRRAATADQLRAKVRDLEAGRIR
jgi:hypothetical protein